MKTAIIYISIIAGALAIGAGGGALVKRTLAEGTVEYQGDFDSYKIDANALYEKFMDSSGKDLEKQFSPAELINIGLEKYRRCWYSYSYTIGSANAMGLVDQSVRSYQIRNKNTYFEESLSKSSFVAVSNRAYQTMNEDGSEGDVTLHLGNAVSAEEGTYTGDGTTYTASEYRDYLGKTPSEMFIYVISDKTVTDSKVTKTNDGGYEIYIELDPVTSTQSYKTQMKNISGLSGMPSFSYLRQTYYLDADMYLVSASLEEAYSASMSGINAKIVAKLENKYFPNQKMEVPEINTPLDYSAKGENE